MDLQTEDKSNKALTVGTLNVLGGMKSDELTAIHTHLQTQDGVQSRIIADMQKLHESISADGVITANEKQMLKKELTIIETEYPLIITKAEAAKKSKIDIEAYKDAYRALIDYLYNDIRIFDDMSSALSVDRDVFNKHFAAYYKQRAVLQIAKDGKPADMSFPSDENALVHTCFDETPQAIPAPSPSYTAWQSRIIEYDCTGKTDITMTFAEALNNVIILSGELQNDFTLKLFFDKQNGNGTKQYLIVYKLTGYFNVIIGTEEAGTNKISQNITAKTFGLGCYAVVDFKGNVWAFEGNIKQSLIDEILQHAENKLNNSIEHTVNNFQNAVNSFFFEEKNKINIFIQEKMNEIKNYHKDRFIKLSGSIGEIRYFTRKNYTYGYLYANGYSFIPELYPEFYQFWLENFGDKKKKNYLGYDAFGYPKLPDLRGVSLRAVDDGANQGGVLQALEYQHDAIRNIRGEVGAFQIGYYGGFGTITGAFGAKHQDISTDSGTGGDEGRVINFDASRVVPTAEDNRVKSYGVYPFIKVI